MSAVLIGLTLQEAQNLIATQDIFHDGNKINSIRATSVDGQPRMMTMDYRTDRLNVSLQDGKISAISNCA
jgi:hypothetical protein